MRAIVTSSFIIIIGVLNLFFLFCITFKLGVVSISFYKIHVETYSQSPLLIAESISFLTDWLTKQCWRKISSVIVGSYSICLAYCSYWRELSILPRHSLSRHRRHPQFCDHLQLQLQLQQQQQQQQQQQTQIINYYFIHNFIIPCIRKKKRR